jgi:hypothetical protein
MTASTCQWVRDVSRDYAYSWVFRIAFDRKSTDRKSTRRLRDAEAATARLRRAQFWPRMWTDIQLFRLAVRRSDMLRKNPA